MKSGAEARAALATDGYHIIYANYYYYNSSPTGGNDRLGSPTQIWKYDPATDQHTFLGLLGKHYTWTGGTIARHKNGTIYAIAADNVDDCNYWWLKVDPKTGEGTPVAMLRGYVGKNSCGEYISDVAFIKGTNRAALRFGDDKDLLKANLKGGSGIWFLDWALGDSYGQGVTTHRRKIISMEKDEGDDNSGNVNFGPPTQIPNQGIWALGGLTLPEDLWVVPGGLARCPNGHMVGALGISESEDHPEGTSLAYWNGGKRNDAFTHMAYSAVPARSLVCVPND